MARRGVSSCAVGLVCLAFLPQFTSTHPTVAFRLLQAAAVCMAFTSATVVNSLTAHASLQCDEGGPAEGAAAANGNGKSHGKAQGKSIKEKVEEPTHPELAKGKALGQFRSSGQLGRAIGPLLGMSYFLPSSCLYNMAINLRYPLYHITLLPCRFTPISSRHSCRYPSMDYTHDVPVPSPLQPCCAPANIDRFWSCSTACASYWTFGPSTTYTLSAALMFALSINMRKLAASL